MVRKSESQFSLLEMLLVFALLTTLEAYLFTPMSVSRTEINLHLILWVVVIISLAGAIRWEMLRGTPSRAGDWWLVGLASLIVFVNGISVGAAIQWSVPFYLELAALCFLDVIAVLIYSAIAQPRPRLLPLGFHLIVMTSLLVYNLYNLLQQSSR